MAGMPGIVIKIGAETQDAIQGINRVQKALGDGSNSLTDWNRKNDLLNKSILGVAAAAGTMAVVIGVDAVQAAAAEETAIGKLNTTLGNLGFADAADGVGTFIDNLRFTSGVADDELRPAFDRLVRSTKDVTEAEGALSLALDISKGSGKSLESVAAALGKAYDGNTGALGKLGIGIDAATLKTGNMDAILKVAATTFTGQAYNASQKLEGQFARLKDGVGELQESLGTGIIEGFSDAMGGTTDTADGLATALRNLQPAAAAVGREFGTYFGNIGNIASALTNLTGAAYAAAEGNSAMSAALSGVGTVASFVAGGPIINLVNSLGTVIGQLNGVSGAAWAASAAISSIGGGDFTPAGQTVGGKPYFGGTPTAVQSTAAMSSQIASSRKWATAQANAAAAARKAAAAIGGGGGGGGGGGSVASAIQKVNPLLQKQINLTQKHIDTLTGAGGYLETLKALTEEQSAYANGVSQTLLGNISLDDSYTLSLDNARKQLSLDKDITTAKQDQADAQERLNGLLGEAEADRSSSSITSARKSLEKANRDLADAMTARTGFTGSTNVVDLFTKQIGDVTAFSGELASLGMRLPKTAGARMLITQLQGLGVDNGRAVIAGLTTEVATNLAGQLDSAITAVSGNAWLLADHFYGEGVAAELQLVQGMIAQIEADEERLREIGKKVGQPIGEEIKNAIVTAINEAMAAVRAAQAEGGDAVVTPTAPARNPLGQLFGQPVNITVNTGVGDPVRIAREVKLTMTEAARRTGRR